MPSHTRAGEGGVRKVESDGFVIAQFRHRTSRSTDPGERVGDPQLHSHCAILNRVRGVDGVWRTLDSRAIYRHAHAAGAVYAAELERVLSERLGVSWERPQSRTPMREIVGIPADLRATGSRRAVPPCSRPMGGWRGSGDGSMGAPRHATRQPGCVTRQRCGAGTARPAARSICTSSGAR